MWRYPLRLCPAELAPPRRAFGQRDRRSTAENQTGNGAHHGHGSGRARSHFARRVGSLCCGDGYAAAPLAYNTVEDYLRTDSSVQINQRGSGGYPADLSIRGTSFEQTLVLLDGFRVNDAEAAHNNLDLPVPLDAMTNIEVLHGAGSTLYGADALGGVADFLTARPAASSLWVSGGGGSFGENQQTFVGNYARRNWAEQIAGHRDFSSGFMYDRDYRNENGSTETWVKSPLGTSDVLLAGSDTPFGANNFYGNYPSWERTKGWFASIPQGLGAVRMAALPIADTPTIMCSFATIHPSTRTTISTPAGRHCCVARRSSTEPTASTMASILTAIPSTATILACTRAIGARDMSTSMSARGNAPRFRCRRTRGNYQRRI